MPPNLGFLYDEDDALKEKLSNFVVYNQGTEGTLPIPVWFRFPDPENQQRSYPHFAVDQISVAQDPERAHRAMAGYQPNVYADSATPNFSGTLIAHDMPLPWIIEYQIAAYSLDPRHDRQMTALLYQLFPGQFGFLDMTNIDGTVRRADFVSAERRDSVLGANRRRLYRNIFTVDVSAEAFVNEVLSVPNIQQVLIDFEFYVNQSVPSP
jgi:hypothetical protein